MGIGASCAAMAGCCMCATTLACISNVAQVMLTGFGATVSRPFLNTRKEFSAALYLLVILETLVVAAVTALGLMSTPNLPQSLSLAACVGNEDCIIQGVAFRASFALSTLFAICTLLVCFTPPKLGAAIHHSWFVFKVLFVNSLFFLSLFISQKLFDVYAVGALGISIGYYFVQAVLIIDFTYSWNDVWVTHSHHTGEVRWLIYLVLVSVGLIFGSWSLVSAVAPE
eukprot:GHVN01066110.1.p1 GENE.GHVN01066110.1~~GHVN01066110.1.p1  ORF type:complete len:252 (+),score=5.24 GHVN01066110.1:80-757(+)